MPLLARARSFIRNFLSRGAVERELDEELQSYLDMLSDEKSGRGLRPHEARRQTLAEIGSKESLKERVRERRIGHALDTFRQDLAGGFRMLRKYPAFSLLSIATLALGVAATTAVYSVVQGVLLTRLPYPEPDRLVFVEASARDGRGYLSPPDFIDLRETSTSFEHLGAFQGTVLVTFAAEDRRPEVVRSRDVTPNFLSVYGVSPFLGRTFVPEEDSPVAFEDRGNPDVSLPKGVVMLSYEFWQTRFRGDHGVLGQLVEIDFQPYEIIGVTPPGFRTLLPGEGDSAVDADLWTLARMDFPRMPRDVGFLRVVGRLRAETTLSSADAEASIFAERQRSLYELHQESGYEVDILSLHRTLTHRYSGSIWMLFGAVGFLLLIACGNLANLLLTRTLARRKELAMRMVLGSGRARLARQLLTESSLYAILGAAVGLPLAHLLASLFVRWAPRSIPRIDDVGIDGNVLVFAVAVSFLATTLVALLPALAFSRPREIAALRSAGRGTRGTERQPWDRVFVVVEVALSVILVIGTGLFLESLSALLSVDPGFRAEGVLTADVNLPSRRYPRYPRADTRVRFVRQVAERVSELPGVDDVALALVVPLSHQDAGHTYATEDTATNLRLPSAKYRPVTPAYFRAAGTTLLAGRDFTWQELEQFQAVSIVDESLAAKAWPNESPLGKRLRVEVWSTLGGSIHLEPVWTEVIGVAESVRSSALGVVDPETVYLPYGLYAVSELSLLVRTSAEPLSLVAPVRAAVARIDPDLALFHVRRMEDLVADSVAAERFSLRLLGTFGGTGLAMALIGLYGVLSHIVSLRRRELGIRMALGAHADAVLRLVMARGARMIMLGLGIGLGGASVLARLLAGELYSVPPVDLGVYSSVALMTLLTSLGACYFPARRASRINPIETLRAD